MRMELTDSRRLTGANLFWDHPSAIIDVHVEGPAEEVIETWQAAAGRWLDAVGFAGEQTCHRLFEGGASLLISAPIDALYSMCELNEVAWGSTLHAFGLAPAPDPVEQAPRLMHLFEEERNPRLLALQEAAALHGLPFLWDDDEVSVGYGQSALIWPSGSLPEVGEVDWSTPGSIPVALVTGTNGKSTTVRMTAAIMNAAGFRAGLTSTDFIRVGDRLIDRGDYSGPGGARTLLRQPDVDMAVLEVARGGLLRRGLGVAGVDVAVVTNVAEDHLGEYGIHSVDELLEAKFIVHKALAASGTLVLNADDAGVLAYGETLNCQKLWFSLDTAHPRISAARAAGDPVCYLEDEWLMASDAEGPRRIVPVAAVTAARGGTVRHNLANALAAVGISVILGLSNKAIREGLQTFRGDESDNPGRGNWFERWTADGQVRILVDFAHNEHGMKALADTVARAGAERVLLQMGQAGDRTDREIAGLVRAACGMNPRHLLVTELPGYERGRDSFEVPQLIREHALACGLDASRIGIYPDPLAATEQALKWARPGDLLVLLALTQRREMLALIHSFIEGTSTGNG